MSAPQENNMLETIGYWLSLAGLIAVILGIHFCQLGVGIVGVAAVVVGIALNLAGEKRAARGNQK